MDMDKLLMGEVDQDLDGMENQESLYLNNEMRASLLNFQQMRTQENQRMGEKNGGSFVEDSQSRLPQIQVTSADLLMMGDD